MLSTIEGRELDVFNPCVVHDLSKSRFESVFNPSRRVHLPEPRLHFLLFSSHLAGLHLLHEILEVLPLEGLEFLLVLLRLVTIGLSYAFEEGGAGLDIFTCPIEEGGEAELLRVLVHLLEARGEGLQFLFLSLSLGNLSLCCLHSQVDFGGLAVVDRPIDKAHELAKIDVVLGLIGASVLVFAPELLKLLKLRHSEAQVNIGRLDSLHLSLELIGIFEEQLDIDGLSEAVVTEEGDECLHAVDEGLGALRLENLVEVFHLLF